jgi:hypothetical protein
MKDFLGFLRNNSVFWSKLGFCYDPPRLGPDGQPVVFFENFERFSKFHRDFANAGVRIHTSILFNGWVGVDRYDYRLTDKVLDAALKDNPDIYYIPRIKLNVPPDWVRENPEDVFVYWGGPETAGEISALAGTDKHDFLGYDSPKGYYTAGGWEDGRPNVGGVISNQSFSSKKWLADAGETLRRLVSRLENGPFGERIAAYHIAYGTSGETCLWGRFGKPAGVMGDYGINNRRAFFDWGLRKHGSLEALRAAWRNPSLTRENAAPPSPGQRTHFKEGVKDLRSFFRAGEDDLICPDYDGFMSDVNAGAAEHFGKIVKETCGGKPVGSFYGYFLECANSAYPGWLAYERLLGSPYIDFIAAPKSYYRSGPGEPGGELGPAQSVNLKKLWMDELDNRTHLCATDERSCADMGETRAVLRREFSKNLAHGSGFWWMDLGGGWFDSPEILEEVSKMEREAALIRSRPGKSFSEVLMVCDDRAVLRAVCRQSFHDPLMKDLVREANLCGVPVDTLRLADLETVDLSQYKLLVFMNIFSFEPGQWGGVERRIPGGSVLMWHYAPGILGPEFSLSNVERLTGVKIRERAPVPEPCLIPEPGSILDRTAEMTPYQRGCKADYPMVEIADWRGLKILARYQDGAPAAALTENKGRRIVYSALPLFRAEHLRRVMETAGVHFYTPLNCVVYGDSRFMGIFPSADIDGALRFPSESEWTDADGVSLKGKEFPLKMKAKSFKFLRRTC